MWHILQSFAYAVYGPVWLHVSLRTFFFREGFRGSTICSDFSASRLKRKNKVLFRTILLLLYCLNMYFISVSEHKYYRVWAVETYSERRICWDFAFWRPAQEALGVWVLYWPGALCSPSTVKEMQRHHKTGKMPPFIWCEYVQINSYIFVDDINLTAFFLAWASDAASSSVFFFFFLFFLDLAAPPDGSWVSFSSSNTGCNKNRHSF